MQTRVHFTVAFVSETGGRRLKSRAGQIGHSVANDSPSVRLLSKGTVLRGRNDAETGPANAVHALA